ncbi:MAG: hypothetical protein E7166_01140 [Firmicutes bacterium]|nr:hypothetical protein [Bacillota bacterium]
MQNKVLIKLIVPELDTSFDIFIPVNEVVWKIRKLILMSISDLTNIPIDINSEYLLINKDTCKVYKNNDVIVDTDVRNSSEIILVSR